MSSPRYVTGSAATRPVTGAVGVVRMTSSTAWGASVGCSASSRHWSGWAMNVFMARPSCWRVVAPPWARRPRPRPPGTALAMIDDTDRFPVGYGPGGVWSPTCGTLRSLPHVPPSPAVYEMKRDVGRERENRDGRHLHQRRLADRRAHPGRRGREVDRPVLPAPLVPAGKIGRAHV